MPNFNTHCSRFLQIANIVRQVKKNKFLMHELDSNEVQFNIKINYTWALANKLLILYEC